MKPIRYHALFLLIMTFVAYTSVMAQPTVWKQDLRAYNIVWDSPSRDSFESMPLPGARGAGANVWVQDGALWLYLAHNSAYDEEGRLLKLGCLRLTPIGLDWHDPTSFRQEQDLATGTIRVTSTTKDGTCLTLHLQFLGETLLVNTTASRDIVWEVAYGTWRDVPRLVQMDLFGSTVPIGADSVATAGGALHFVHRNGATQYENNLALGQGVPLDAVLNLLSNRNFGGVLVARGGLTFTESAPVAWQTWQGKAWLAKTVKAKEHVLAVTLGAAKNAEPAHWEATARALLTQAVRAKAEKKEAKRWVEFWNRSFIFISPGGNAKDPAFQVGRNYQLFRQMLACNQGGEFPLKFNGGIFTTDTHPDRVPARLNNPDIGVAPANGTSPDFRRWGQMFMSQNQRWLGWPTLATGDADLLSPSTAFYRDRLPVAEARAKNIKAEGACYAEPLGIDGTVCVIPNKQGLCTAPHLLYHFSMGLENAWMTLQAHDMSGVKIDADIRWMVEIVRFFDSFYRRQTKERSGSELDTNGKLVLYPANALELLGGATNPIDEVSGLCRVTKGLLSLPELSEIDRAFLLKVGNTLPELPTMIRDGKTVLAPAAKWEAEYNPWELPELYAAWPYRFVGVTQPQTLTLVRDTWSAIPLRGDNKKAIYCKMDFSWQSTLANTAAMGLVDEAQERAIAKLSDSASACRYPAFFGPGHDWMPDHNWGGSGMVGLQEMLIASEPGSHGKIYLLPAWPKNWDVCFKLHTSGETTVEGEVKSGQLIRFSVLPKSRLKDVVPATGWQMPGTKK
jgi:hypothetical protein